MFLGAFLLFQVQPVAAKAILPWFGGASSVWNTCMLFFQAALVAGYGYAHLVSRLEGRRQAIVHGALLAASLLVLPPLPGAWWKSAAVEHPSARILLLLAATVGLPYFLLSSTSPLLQSWFARTHPGRSPYRLFALSNFASLLALGTYPVLVEPRLALPAQGWIWSAAYAGFALLCGGLAWSGSRALPPALTAHGKAAPPRWDVRVLWVLLPAAASILLLAVTTYLTQDVAAIPFLWVLPLCIYLLSFIICFDATRHYRRRLYLLMLPVALGIMAYLLSPYQPGYNVLQVVAVSNACLFVFCMVCHGELVRLKPEPARLTAFYFSLSVGGALGGVFVGLAAPSLFVAYHEFPIGLALCAALALAVLAREGLRRWTLAAGLAALAGYAGFLGYSAHSPITGCRLAVRNFYGLVRVWDVDEEDGAGVRRKLVHGHINHGEQLLSKEYRRSPVTYFCPETGIGHAMRASEARGPRRIGILGLGAGVLAAYGRPGDTLRIYEINPLVLDIASREFTYLSDTPARVETVLGDGRLALEHEPAQNFDVLVMDAFSGDSVPVHLISREAFAVYFRHLKPGGVLAVNISNRYLGLGPVMERAARHFGRVPVEFQFTPDDEDVVCFGASWVLLVEPGSPLVREGAVLKERRDFRMWTDGYSNLFGVLK
ncbi:MAG: spermidine synthase [Bryobacteraceae bacterium]